MTKPGFRFQYARTRPITPREARLRSLWHTGQREGLIRKNVRKLGTDLRLHNRMKISKKRDVEHGRRTYLKTIAFWVLCCKVIRCAHQDIKVLFLSKNARHQEENKAYLFTRRLYDATKNTVDQEQLRSLLQMDDATFRTKVTILRHMIKSTRFFEMMLLI